MPRSDEENRKDIAAVVAAFYQALASGDTKQITALTDASFVWLRGQGKDLTRDELIDSLSQLRYGKPESGKETISFYGETAVVRNENSRTILVNQGGAWKLELLYTSKYVLVLNQ
jgi:hypothetical protein